MVDIWGYYFPQYFALVYLVLAADLCEMKLFSYLDCASPKSPSVFLPSHRRALLQSLKAEQQ